MTSLAVNYGWTPELIAQDMALKEKYGAGAHITPAKTYVTSLERSPEEDGFAPKKSDKNNTATKVAVGVALTALAAFALKKGVPKLKQMLGLGKKTPQHAPQTVTAGEKKMLDQFAKIDKFKSESKFVKNVVDESRGSDKWIKVSYSDGAPYAKGRISNLEGPGSKWASITLNDGKEVAFKFSPQSPNAKIKVPEYYTWESADLGITLGSAENAKEAYTRILNGLNANGYDGAAVVAELKRLTQLI